MNTGETQKALQTFYEQVGEKYPEEEEVYHTLRGKLRKKFVLSYLTVMRGTLLDIGCNRGMYLNLYKKGPCYGMDLSRAVLKKARRQKVIHYFVADAERLQAIQGERFDNVLCSEVLEHCLHPEQIFSGIAHVLRPGGRALLTTPNYTRHRPQWIALGALEHYQVSSDCHDGYFHTAYRAEELSDLALRAGFKIVAIGTFEKEVKYAAKIPAVLLLTVRWCNTIIKSKRLERWNEKLFNHFTNTIYYFALYTGLHHLVMPFIKEGVRSFIWMEKSPSR
jgi:2-polyprenyl-3-methyl-5-hydroxy-6-metoxy-1,4-benzoquinol methylase